MTFAKFYKYLFLQNSSGDCFRKISAIYHFCSQNPSKIIGNNLHFIHFILLKGYIHILLFIKTSKFHCMFTLLRFFGIWFWNVFNLFLIYSGQWINFDNHALIQTTRWLIQTHMKSFFKWRWNSYEIVPALKLLTFLQILIFNVFKIFLFFSQLFLLEVVNYLVMKLGQLIDIVMGNIFEWLNYIIILNDFEEWDLNPGSL